MVDVEVQGGIAERVEACRHKRLLSPFCVFHEQVDVPVAAERRIGIERRQLRSLHDDCRTVKGRDDPLEHDRRRDRSDRCRSFLLEKILRHIFAGRAAKTGGDNFEAVAANIAVSRLADQSLEPGPELGAGIPRSHRRSVPELPAGSSAGTTRTASAPHPVGLSTLVWPWAPARPSLGAVDSTGRGCGVEVREVQ